MCGGTTCVCVRACAPVCVRVHTLHLRLLLLLLLGRRRSVKCVAAKRPRDAISSVLASSSLARLFGPWARSANSRTNSSDVHIFDAAALCRRAASSAACLRFDWKRTDPFNWFRGWKHHRQQQRWSWTSRPSRSQAEARPKPPDGLGRGLRVRRSLAGSQGVTRLVTDLPRACARRPSSVPAGAWPGLGVAPLSRGPAAADQVTHVYFRHSSHGRSRGSQAGMSQTLLTRSLPGEGYRYCLIRFTSSSD